MENNPLDAILSLVAESKAAAKDAKRAKADAINTVLARPVYHWILASEVCLQVTNITCLNCGARYATPGYIMLKYEAKGATRWKRLEPCEVLPQHPLRTLQKSDREVSVCQECFFRAEIKVPEAPAQQELSFLDKGE